MLRRTGDVSDLVAESYSRWKQRPLECHCVRVRTEETGAKQGDWRGPKWLMRVSNALAVRAIPCMTGTAAIGSQTQDILQVHVESINCTPNLQRMPALLEIWWRMSCMYGTMYLL
eukprot:6197593-Pleurochrysis_carterae.AAC.2